MEPAYPRYVIRPFFPRVLIPEVLKVTGLCILFYAGIWVNAFLLKMEIPEIINIIIWSFLALLVALDVILKLVKSRKLTAEVYTDRIIIHSPEETDEIMWLHAAPPSYEQNFLDKMFKTATITVGMSNIHFVKNYEKLTAYLEQYRKYAEYYARYYAQQHAVRENTTQPGEAAASGKA